MTDATNAGLIGRLRGYAAVTMATQTGEAADILGTMLRAAADALSAADARIAGLEAEKTALAKHIDGCVRVAAEALDGLAQARKDALEEAIAAINADVSPNEDPFEGSHYREKHAAAIRALIGKETGE